MQSALDIGRFEHLILQKHLFAIQESDVTGIFRSGWRSMTSVAFSVVARRSRTFSRFISLNKDDWRNSVIAAVVLVPATTAAPAWACARGLRGAAAVALGFSNREHDGERDNGDEWTRGVQV
jgi:hypothetical protein